MAKNKTETTTKRRGRPPKNTTTPPPVTSNKNDKKARERVNSLVGDITSLSSLFSGGSKKEEKEVLIDKDKEWLTEEIARLGEVNGKLEKENDKFKEDYQKIHKKYEDLKQKGKSTPQQQSKDSGDEVNLMKSKILKIFQELYDNLHGRNSLKRPWHDVKIKYMLTRLGNDFPFI